MVRISGNYINNQTFNADKDTVDARTGEYKDPLMHWPLRGAAFSNEVGEAIRPLIGSYANLTWIPALMYIGADVYDKYKNNQTEYSPDSKRCLKQAIFQGLASIFLPVLAVKIGQNAFSQLGKFSKDKISLNSKEQISKVAEQFIANGKMRAFDGQDSECVKEFLSQVNNSMDFNNNKRSLKNLFNIYRLDSKNKIESYAEKNITDLIQLRKDMLNPDTKIKAGKWYSKYIKALKSGQTESVAVKTVLSDFQKNKLLKGNFIKTIGGFTALGLAIKPIDNFVENVLIGKYVGPRIDNLNINQKKASNS